MLASSKMIEDPMSNAEAAFLSAQVFSDLPEADRRHLLGFFWQRPFAAGEALFLEGDPASTYYLLGAGRVKAVETSAEGFEVILHVSSPGDLVGAPATLGSGVYPASAVALSDGLAFGIRAQAFEELLRAYPPVAMRMLRILAEMLQGAHHRLRELATERVEQRIARTLSRLAATVGREVGRTIVLDVPLSRKELGELTGTTPFTVSRTLKEWERRGLVQARRQRVVLLDPPGLAAIGEDLQPVPSSS